MEVLSQHNSQEPPMGDDPPEEREKPTREAAEAEDVRSRHNASEGEGMDERYQEKYVDEKLDRVRDEMRFSVNALGGRVDTLSGRIDALSGRMDELGGRMDRLESTMDTMRLEMQGFRREFREELQETRREFREELQESRREFREQMKEFRRESREEMVELRADNKSTRRTVITTGIAASLAALALIVAIVIGGSQIASTITSAWLTTEHNRIEQKLQHFEHQSTPPTGQVSP